jgi:hypothetical protein
MYPGADGGVSMFTIDITARKKAEQRLTLISKVQGEESMMIQRVPLPARDNGRSCRLYR